MAFGQELKDFVDGFKVGQGIKGNREDRKDRREREADRKREREEDRKYRQDRDEKLDTRHDREFDYRRESDGRSQERWDIMMGLERDKLKYQREMDLMGKTSGDGYAIPDDLDQRSSRDRPQKSSREDGDDLGSATAMLDTSLVNYGGDDQRHYRENMVLARNGPSGGSPQYANYDAQSYYRSTKSRESGGDQYAKNPNSSASGHYQFIDSTWAGLMKNHPELGLTRDGRFNAGQQQKAMEQFTANNIKSLSSSGVPITNGTVYAAHFLGDGGAKKVFSSDPRTPMSRLVGPDALQANPFLKNMSAADFYVWAEDRGGGPLAGGGRRQNKEIRAARGGMIEALPMEDEEDQLQVAQAQSSAPAPAPAPQQALPTEGPIPQSRPTYEGVSDGDSEPPTDDPFERGRRAVRDGLKRSLERNGLGQEGAIEDPRMEKMRRNYLMGYGAATPQMMKQILDKVDPDKEMSASERNMYAIGEVYNYFVEKGDLTRAKEAAADMVQYQRQAASKFLAVGQAALADGDLSTAARAAVAAYAQIPNGQDLQVKHNEKNNTYTVTVTNEDTGKQVAKEILDPKEFAEMAMGFNVGTFDQSIMDAAGANSASDTEKSSDISRMGNAISELIEEQFGEGNELSPESKSFIGNLATSITTFSGNSMGEREAILFARRLLGNGLDTNGDPVYSLKKVPGDTNGSYQVTLNGQSAVISGNQAQELQTNLKGLSDGIKALKKRADDEAEAKKKMDEANEANSRRNPPRSKRELDEARRGSRDLDAAVRNASDYREQLRLQREQERAIEDGAVSDDYGEYPPEVAELLKRRDEIRNSNQAGYMGQALADIDRRLRELGYEDPEE